MEDQSFGNVENMLKEERVMLIGGAGFIGHNLALQLAEAGVTTLVVDNLMLNNLVDNVYSQRNRVQRAAYMGFLLSRFSLMRDAGIELVNGDARLLSDLNLIFDEFEPTKVVHLSAIASSVDAKTVPGLMFDLQLTTLRNILELARTSHRSINQIMFLSSSTVYGDFEGDSVDESARPKPKGIYANTKYMGERLLRTYAHQYGTGCTIIRPSALYGERCISRRVSQVFIENALTGKPLLLEGGGDGRLDFTDINDLVIGMIRALAIHAGEGATQTLNLTLGQARTIADLAGIVRDVIPNVILEERPRMVEKPVRGTLSIDRARTQIGFAPKSTLETGYRRYCEWYVTQWDKAKQKAESGDWI
jgi:nucleoside-diphosphate-sugar epimerase